VLRQAGTWGVFLIKRKADGSIDKYKACLVARGFTQVHGVDFFATFSPVAKLSSFRAVLAIAARNDWEVNTFDFNGAYLNGELDEGEEIYMQEPPGYEEGDGNVKRLQKSLYGLKQAGRKWCDALSRTMADIGFVVIHNTIFCLLALVIYAENFTSTFPRLSDFFHPYHNLIIYLMTWRGH
jgi:Reverse transcriptase (RNA-dependent DNA polymerase)